MNVTNVMIPILLLVVHLIYVISHESMNEIIYFLELNTLLFS